ncbi:MAG: Asp-tRNA(Asn)/Glu-tRNA(Gln) amidotransferase subunit GatC [Bacteroidota bacterium]
MKIDRPLLQKMAQLAQLEVDTHSEKGLIEELSKIVTWIEKLQELDTAGVAPLDTMSMACNSLQEDVPETSLTHEQALANAPSRDTNYFRVPQVKT